MCSFKFLTVGNAATDFFNDFAQGCTHGNFNETGIGDLTTESKYFGTLGFFGTHRGEPIGTIVDDLCDIRIGFNVVDDGGLTVKTLYCRERRTGARFASVTFDRSEKSRFFTANECTSTKADVHIKIKTGIENIFAKQAVFSCLFDSDFQTVNCDGIFGTDVYVAFVCTDCIASDRHCFDERMGVTFQNGTVHKCTGVTFVCVTNNVFLIRNAICCKLPFATGGETAAATTAQTGCKDFIDNLLRSHFGKNLTKGHVTVYSDVFFNLFGIDDTTVAERNSLLLLIEGSFSKGVNFNLVFVINESVNDSTFEQMFGNDLRNIFDFYVGVESAFWIYHHDRAESAKTEATSLYNLDFFCKTCVRDLFDHLETNFVTLRRRTTSTTADKYV